MPNTVRKFQPADSRKKLSPQRNLNLVVGHVVRERGRKEGSHRALYRFLVVVALVVTGLVYLGFNKTQPFALTEQSFSQLHDVYQNEGIRRFLEEKAKLRSQIVLQIGSSEDSDVRNEANNIALYLFPDALESDNLEREVGLEEWAPLQKDIEDAPGSSDSRRKFEELRASIWNYESPSRSAPQLSPQARQVIRIYKTLSGP